MNDPKVEGDGSILCAVAFHQRMTRLRMHCPKNANEDGYPFQAEQKPLYNGGTYSCSELSVMY